MVEGDTAGAGGTKRRADPGGGELTRKPPLPAQMKPPPAKRAKTQTSPKAKVGWPDLTPELHAEVATNLAVGPELVNFCTVVGKDVARVVKQTYLYKNDRYILRVWERFSSRRPFHFSRFRELVYEWMDCNEDYWPFLCLGRRHEMNLKTAFVTVEDAKSLTLQRKRYNILLGDAVIVSIGDTNIDGMSLENTRELLLRSASDERNKGVTITYIHFANLLFSHPVVAGGCGLVRVVKHLIEEGLVKPNAVYPHSGRDDPLCDDTLFLPLLAHSFSYRDFSVFKYLLTVKDIDVNGKVNGLSHVHNLARFEHVPCEMLGRFLENPLVDRNARDENGRTAVHLLVVYLSNRFHEAEEGLSRALPHNFMMGKLGCLLSAGSDTRIRDNYGMTAEDYLGLVDHALTSQGGNDKLLSDIEEVRNLIAKYT